MVDFDIGGNSDATSRLIQGTLLLLVVFGFVYVVLIGWLTISPFNMVDGENKTNVTRVC